MPPSCATAEFQPRVADSATDMLLGRARQAAVGHSAWWSFAHPRRPPWDGATDSLPLGDALCLEQPVKGVRCAGLWARVRISAVVRSGLLRQTPQHPRCGLRSWISHATCLPAGFSLPIPSLPSSAPLSRLAMHRPMPFRVPPCPMAPRPSRPQTHSAVAPPPTAALLPAWAEAACLLLPLWFGSWSP
jgi:hypothetical protein